MKIITVLGAIVVGIHFFFAFVFAIAASVANASTRLVVASLLFALGIVIVIYLGRQPKTITQKIEFPGQMQAVELKCPNCSASVNSQSIRIVSGVPYATCSYCGHTFQVAEEPKW